MNGHRSPGSLHRPAARPCLALYLPDHRPSTWPLVVWMGRDRSVEQPTMVDGSPAKIIHLGKLVSPNGDVSPWCAKTPKKINLAKETWTNRRDAVTCPRCRKVMPERKA